MSQEPPSDHESPTELEAVRGQIDSIDEAIADLVEDRLALAEDVAAVKREDDRTLVDGEREAVVEQHYASAFESAGVDGDHGTVLPRVLIEASLETERPA